MRYLMLKFLFFLLLAVCRPVFADDARVTVNFFANITTDSIRCSPDLRNLRSKRDVTDALIQWHVDISEIEDEFPLEDLKSIYFAVKSLPKELFPADRRIKFIFDKKYIGAALAAYWHHGKKNPSRY